MSTMIFGVLSASEDSTEPRLTVAPPSPYARRIPMHTHPSKCPASPPRPRWTYKNNITVSNDPVYEVAVMEPKQSMDFGMYVGLNDPQERITTPGLAFMADTFESMAKFIPGDHKDMREKR